MPLRNFTIRFKAMGTQMQVWLAAEGDHDAVILESVPFWFAKWEAIFSRFLQGSELSHINRHPGQWVAVSQTMLEVVSAALDAAQKTGGLFNPLILPALEAAGYDHSFGSVGTGQFIPGGPRLVSTIPDWRAIEIDPVYQALRIPVDARLDLGGIVKGWAAQQAAQILMAIGPCLVNVGGDMMARGSPDDSGGWLVTLPQANTVSSTAQPPGDAQRILLTNSAVATSGTTYRRWQRSGETLHHLIDPRTGQPSRSDVIMATVVALDASQAEAEAKAALIDAVLPVLPARFIKQDGTYLCNAAFKCLLHSSFESNSMLGNIEE